MEKRKCWGIGQVVFSEKEQLVLLRPLDGVLTMSMLRHEKEMRTAQELGIEPLLLQGYYAIEKRRYPRSPESQRLLD